MNVLFHLSTATAAVGILSLSIGIHFAGRCLLISCIIRRSFGSFCLLLWLHLEQLNLSFTIFPDTSLGDGGSIVRLSTSTQQAPYYGTTFGDGLFLL